MYDLNEFIESVEKDKNKNLLSQDIFNANIGQLIIVEVDRIIKKYGYFKNNHEFHSVLNEELDEVNDEIIKVNEIFGMIWNDVKKNYSDDKIKIKVEGLTDVVNKCIAELIQIQAVLLKYSKGKEE